MAAELDPLAAAERLRVLAAMYVAETVDEARERFAADERLAAEQAAARESFDVAAARRLAELRALVELSKVLQGAAEA